MSLLENTLILAVSLFALAKSAEVLIDKGTTLARFLRVSELAVGFLLVSIATTLPEMTVSLVAASSGQTGIVVGNIFGSNITNLCLILGISALAGGIALKRRDVPQLARVLLLITVIPLVLLFAGNSGLVAALLFGGYLLFAYDVLRGKMVAGGKDGIRPPEAVRDIVLLFMAGLALAVSAKFTVSSAVSVADAVGLSNAFVGATIIAVGTSLPELAVSLNAVARRHAGIAVGNLLGASATNLTLNLGLAALISPITANPAVALNLIAFATIANLALLFFLRTRRKLGKNEGLVLVGLFIAYLAALVAVELGN